MAGPPLLLSSLLLSAERVTRARKIEGSLRLRYRSREDAEPPMI